MVITHISYSRAWQYVMIHELSEHPNLVEGGRHLAIIDVIDWYGKCHACFHELSLQ